MNESEEVATVWPAPVEDKPKTIVNMRMDTDLLRRIDADAKRVGISRSAWLHVAAHEKLDRS
jgi:hypothetical protein